MTPLQTKVFNAIIKETFLKNVQQLAEVHWFVREFTRSIGKITNKPTK